MTELRAVSDLRQRTHTIGEVINLLRPNFPDVTVSKIRFLESKGLIQPERSASGYRMFSDDNVRRIEYVLTEQRDHFLPLKVIKSKLVAWEKGEASPVAPDHGPPPEAYFASSGVSLTESEISRSSGLSRDQLAAIIAEGLLEPTELPDGSLVFTDADLQIARATNRLLTRGLEPRHLRRIRLAADRQTDLLGQLVAPLLRHRNPDNQRRSAEILADTAQASAAVQETLVRSRLRKLLEH
ncbi:MAG: MerR family transcriptional regulator [Acidimicrobiia bacterium]|nr:MAG: MerR family transcriptional regulator [Acidimicrobiia bacterium]